MNVHSNTTPLDLAAMSGRAKTVADLIDGLPSILAECMQEMHGGRFSVTIDHSAQFILIAQDLLGVARPASGRIV